MYKASLNKLRQLILSNLWHSSQPKPGRPETCYNGELCRTLDEAKAVIKAILAWCVCFLPNLLITFLHRCCIQLVPSGYVATLGVYKKCYCYGQLLRIPFNRCTCQSQDYYRYGGLRDIQLELLHALWAPAQEWGYSWIKSVVKTQAFPFTLWAQVRELGHMMQQQLPESHY